MPFGKRATVYSGVANLRDIIQAEVAAKRNGNAGHRYGSKGLETIPEEELETGDLGTGNGEMLVTGELNNQLWFFVNGVSKYQLPRTFATTYEALCEAIWTKTSVWWSWTISRKICRFRFTKALDNLILDGFSPLWRDPKTLVLQYALVV